MKMRIGFVLVMALSFLHPYASKADDLFQLFWRGTYYTTNSAGRIIAVPFTEQDFVNQVAHNNGLDPAACVFVYRPNRRDTVVVLLNGAFVADVIQMEYFYTDVNNPWGTVTVRQALLFDEAHQHPLGSWMGLELRQRDGAGNLTSDSLEGWMQYSKPELNAVYSGSVTTGRRIVDMTGTPP